jgi:sugar lactone lactonase YvrE
MDGSMRAVAQIEMASDLALGPDGLLYVAAGESVYRLDASGNPTRFAGGFTEARGVAFDQAGNLYVSDSVENSIVRVVMAGDQQPGSGSRTGSDRDGDGVSDDEDLCPDWPGSKETNGC